MRYVVNSLVVLMIFVVLSACWLNYRRSHIPYAKFHSADKRAHDVRCYIIATDEEIPQGFVRDMRNGGWLIGRLGENDIVIINPKDWRNRLVIPEKYPAIVWYVDGTCINVNDDNRNPSRISPRPISQRFNLHLQYGIEV